MVDPERIVERTAAPEGRPVETLAVGDLPPPEPLRETLERLADLDDGVLVQVNDRAPAHLYPELEDRGWCYETVEEGEDVITVVWRG